MRAAGTTDFCGWQLTSPGECPHCLVHRRVAPLVLAMPHDHPASVAGHKWGKATTTGDSPGQITSWLLDHWIHTTHHWISCPVKTKERHVSFMFHQTHLCCEQQRQKQSKQQSTFQCATVHMDLPHTHARTPPPYTPFPSGMKLHCSQFPMCFGRPRTPCPSIVRIIHTIPSFSMAPNQKQVCKTVRWSSLWQCLLPLLREIITVGCVACQCKKFLKLFLHLKDCEEGKKRLKRYVDSCLTPDPHSWVVSQLVQMVCIHARLESKSASRQSNFSLDLWCLANTAPASLQCFHLFVCLWS